MARWHFSLLKIGSADFQTFRKYFYRKDSTTYPLLLGQNTPNSCLLEDLGPFSCLKGQFFPKGTMNFMESVVVVCSSL